MPQLRREGTSERQLGVEESHRLAVLTTAQNGALSAMRTQLGPDVLDDADRLAMFGPQLPQEIPTAPVPAAANTASNVYQFPQAANTVPAVGEMATNTILSEGDPSNVSYLDAIRPDDEYPAIVERAA